MNRANVRQELIRHEPTGIEAAVLKLFTRRAEVASVEPLGEHFRLLTLTGEDLKDTTWIPGQKVQMALGSWVHRTYTPLVWDRVHGTTQLLGYVHGNGPGSAWIASASANAPCVLLGPRASLDLTALPRPLAFFGDETSFGAAASLRLTSGGTNDVAFFFEVSSVTEALPVLERIGVDDAVVIARSSGERHLDEVQARLLRLFEKRFATQAVLTGKASSIQRVHNALRRAGVSGKQLKTRAYWAPGKAGLD